MKKIKFEEGNEYGTYYVSVEINGVLNKVTKNYLSGELPEDIIIYTSLYKELIVDLIK